MSSAAVVIGTLKVKVSETKIGEFANSVDLDEVAQDDPPHQDLHYLHYLPSSFFNLQYDIAWT